MLGTASAFKRRYTKGKVCGKGIGGTVRVAHRTSDGATVAIKKVRGAFNGSTGATLPTLREVKVLQLVDHANIVWLIDVVIHKGESLKLVFEYMQTDLEAVLQSDHFELGHAEAKAFSAMLLSGVAHLHTHQILHRDLKPNNLLLGLDGVLKIADFGRAKQINELAHFEDPATAGGDGSQYSSQLVILHYRAPELLLGARAYGPGIDVWSCASIMADMALKAAPTNFFTVETGEHRMHSDIMQFDRILKILGVPEGGYEAALHAMGNLPDLARWMVSERQPAPCTFSTFFPDAASELVPLLSAMFEFNPALRLAATHALGHSYFTSTAALPLAQSLEQLGAGIEAMLTAEAQQGQARCDSEERWGRGGGGGGGGGGGLFASGSSAGSGGGGGMGEGMGVNRGARSRALLFGGSEDEDDGGSMEGGGGMGGAGLFGASSSNEFESDSNDEDENEARRKRAAVQQTPAFRWECSPETADL